MNKTLNSLFATLLITGAGHAMAASSVDLTVKGLITPSACEPSLPNGGNIEVGKISAKDLNANLPTHLPVQYMPLTVTCDGATLMALEAKDNRQGSDYNDDMMSFGLGLINGDEKLGAMELSLINAVADSVAARTIGSIDGGTTWFGERNLMRNNILAVANASSDVPISVQLLTADMRVHPIIAPTSSLTLTEEALIDGSVTLTVKYL